MNDPDREWLQYRHRLWHLVMAGWKPMVVVNWCCHGQLFITWPEADGLWAEVPVVDAVANCLSTIQGRVTDVVE